MSYLREVTKWANKKEDKHEEQKIRNCTGLVKVYSLSNTQGSQSDTRIYWITFNKIYDIFRDLKNQEILQALLEIQNLKSPAYFSPPQIY